MKQTQWGTVTVMNYQSPQIEFSYIFPRRRFPTATLFSRIPTWGWYLFQLGRASSQNRNKHIYSGLYCVLWCVLSCARKSSANTTRTRAHRHKHLQSCCRNRLWAFLISHTCASRLNRLCSSTFRIPSCASLLCCAAFLLRALVFDRSHLLPARRPLAASSTPPASTSTTVLLKSLLTPSSKRGGKVLIRWEVMLQKKEGEELRKVGPAPCHIP